MKRIAVRVAVTLLAVFLVFKISEQELRRMNNQSEIFNR